MATKKKYPVHPNRKNIWVPKRMHTKVAQAWAQYEGPLSIGDHLAELVEKTLDRHLDKLKKKAKKAAAKAKAA